MARSIVGTTQVTLQMLYDDGSTTKKKQYNILAEEGDYGPRGADNAKVYALSIAINNTTNYDWGANVIGTAAVEIPD